MVRGAKTRGKVAALVTGAEDVEIKATIPESQIDPGLKRFDLTEKNKSQRFIYFFDTPKLDLFQAGVIARARRIPGEEHDSTIKIRPVKPETVPAKWLKYRGFKIEADMSEKGVVPSASFTMPVEKGLIKKVAAGLARQKALFTREQADFLAEMAPKRLAIESVVPLGPIDVWRWKLQDPGLPWPMTVEYWRLENGQRVLEVSIKTPTVQAAAANGGFLAFLAEIGAAKDKGQEAKTRWALEYFAAKLKRAKPAAAANAVQSHPQEVRS